jgi:hypothetical protein
MAWINPLYEEHQRRRWLRHDWQRFLTPAGLAEHKRAGEEKHAVRQKTEQTYAAEQEAFEEEILAPRREFRAIKLEYELWRFQQKYSPDQPRVPKGDSDGGQWTSGEGSGSSGNDRGLEQDRGSLLTTAGDQAPRADLPQLEAIANDAVIRSRIDEAWAASNPHGIPREHGFWISRNDATGELFTRPFANPGTAGNIVPGPLPSDAIASFHTHPLRPDFGGLPGPSRRDLATAASDGLPGLIRSHNGMHYFGPSLRPQRSR